MTTIPKKILIAWSSAALALLALLAALVSCIALAGNRLDRTSKAYVDENIPRIVSGWSESELRRCSSPELLQVAGKDQIVSLFLELKALGPLRSYRGSRGEANMLFSMQKGRLTTAEYVASAEFERGSASVRVRLIRRGGQWQILQFYVDSPILAGAARDRGGVAPAR